MAENKSQLQDVQKRAQDTLTQLGVDIPTALTVLVLALVSGLLAAILDRILELPADHLPILIGGFIAVINGPTYAQIRGRDDLAGVIMAILSGIVALLIWWIVTKIIGDEELAPNYTINQADRWNFIEVLHNGLLLGLLGFGWFALLRRLPNLGGMLKRG